MLSYERSPPQTRPRAPSLQSRQSRLPLGRPSLNSIHLCLSFPRIDDGQCWPPSKGGPGIPPTQPTPAVEAVGCTRAHVRRKNGHSKCERGGHRPIVVRVGPPHTSHRIQTNGQQPKALTPKRSIDRFDASPSSIRSTPTAPRHLIEMGLPLSRVSVYVIWTDRSIEIHLNQTNHSYDTFFQSPYST